MIARSSAFNSTRMHDGFHHEYIRDGIEVFALLGQETDEPDTSDGRCVPVAFGGVGIRRENLQRMIDEAVPWLTRRET
ncbi:MAG: hypothetical protein AAF713_05030 [Pseudomonadota bacterium]